MEPEWLSYQEVADRLGITPEAARSRAKRLGWRRQLSNVGRAMVLVALEPRPASDQPS
jgi:DNA-directed RNA polymerase specialized sigma24 family protein